MTAGSRNRGHVRIVVIDLRSACLQQVDDRQSGAFSRVVDILLVGDPNDQDPRLRKGEPSLGIQHLRHSTNNIVWHCRVDLAGKFNEACVDSVFARLPGEIERIDGNAMSAEARARVESHVSKRLGLGGIDHLKDVDPHPSEDELELVDERNVDRAKYVLGDLHRFSSVGGRNLHHALDDAAIEGGGKRRSCSAVATDHLWNAARRVVAISRILAFGRERQEKVSSRAQAAVLEDRADDLPGRTGISRRFEDDQLTTPQPSRNRLRRVDNKREIGLLMVPEGRWDTYCNYIWLAETREVSRGFKHFPGACSP